VSPSQVHKLIVLVKANRDQVSLIHDLIETGVRYYSQVVSANLYASIGFHLACSAEEYRSRMQEIDRHRRSVHQAFIMCLQAVDRICEQNNIPPIYGGDYENRIQTSRFARDLAEEYFQLPDFHGSELR
jgi:hypothetical protein